MTFTIDSHSPGKRDIKNGDTSNETSISNESMDIYELHDGENKNAALDSPFLPTRYNEAALISGKQHPSNRY
jgi:hypothetical protein